MILARSFSAFAVPLFAFADKLMNAAMPAWAALAIWGIVTGALSTTIYWLTAPRDRLVKLRADARAVREELRASLGDDVEFESAFALALKSIRLSVSEMTLVGGPAIAASAPGLLLIAYLSSAPRYLSSADISPAPWLHGWEGVFFLGALASALILRKVLSVR